MKHLFMYALISLFYLAMYTVVSSDLPFYQFIKQRVAYDTFDIIKQLIHYIQLIYTTLQFLNIKSVIYLINIFNLYFKKNIIYI